MKRVWTIEHDKRLPNFLTRCRVPKFEIFPESDRDYFYKVFDGQMTFVIGEENHAIELVIHQLGKDFHIRRVE